MMISKNILGWSIKHISKSKTSPQQQIQHNTVNSRSKKYTALNINPTNRTNINSHNKRWIITIIISKPHTDTRIPWSGKPIKASKENSQADINLTKPQYILPIQTGLALRKTSSRTTHPQAETSLRAMDIGMKTKCKTIIPNNINGHTRVATDNLKEETATEIQITLTKSTANTSSTLKSRREPPIMSTLSTAKTWVWYCLENKVTF
jgi:hypothetical protein